MRVVSKNEGGLKKCLSTYRYGFNGKEKDDEIKGVGNSYDYGARIYDPRLGRWLAVDPKGQLFPNHSPYNYALGNPIYYIDPDGEVIEVANDKSRSGFNNAIGTIFSGNQVVLDLLLIAGDANSITEINAEDFAAALKTLNDPDRRAVFNGLVKAASSPTVFSLQVVGDDESAFNGTPAQRTGIEIRRDAVGVNEFTDEETGTIMIAIAEAEAGSPRADLAIRDLDALIAGSILSSFVDSENGLNEDPTQKNVEDPGIVQLQSENLILRIKNDFQLTGRDFRSSLTGEKFTSKQLRRVQDTPSPLIIDFSFQVGGIKKFDVSENPPREIKENSLPRFSDR
ncbi:MAG: RHS repeat-associated core domain-containing protein [Flavobacteriales bacterium]|nr:RHS repeat-associated core domain-containing protein [Flavobacteriales bacterium]